MKKKTIRFALCSLSLSLILTLFPGCDTNGGTGEEEGTTVTMVTNEQVYRPDGTLYNGNGTVKIAYDWNDQIPSYLPVDGGKVTGGKLTLSLPATVDNQYLESFSGNPGVTVSPADIQGMEVEEFDLVDGETIYYFYKKHNQTNSGIIYLYASKAGTITGKEAEGHTTYNLTLKKGWNATYWHSEVRDNGNRISTMTTDLSNVPKDMKWVLYSVD
jgi:hypothetical protein